MQIYQKIAKISGDEKLKTVPLPAETMLQSNFKPCRRLSVPEADKL